MRLSDSAADDNFEAMFWQQQASASSSSSSSSSFADPSAAPIFHLDYVGDADNAVFESLHRGDMATYRRVGDNRWVMGTTWTPQQTKRIFSTNLSLTNVVEKEGSDETFAAGDRYFADVVIIRERDKNTRHIRVKPHAVTSTHTFHDMLTQKASRCSMHSCRAIRACVNV